MVTGQKQPIKVEWKLNFWVKEPKREKLVNTYEALFKIYKLRTLFLKTCYIWKVDKLLKKVYVGTESVTFSSSKLTYNPHIIFKNDIDIRYRWKKNGFLGHEGFEVILGLNLHEKLAYKTT